MKIRLHGFNVRYDQPVQTTLEKNIRERLGSNQKDLQSFKIVRRSIDARKKPVQLVFTVDLTFSKELSIKNSNLPKYPIPLKVNPGSQNLSTHPIVVGGGPAGLFAGYLLAKHGYRPLILERGGNINQRNQSLKQFYETRIPNSECNTLFGLGGAGTFSDGKLTTSLSHPWIGSVLELLAQCGAPKSIIIDSKPHIGTDILQTVVTNIVKKIEDLGGIVKTGVRADKLIVKNGRVKAIVTTDGTFDTQNIIMATGHSARETWTMLEKSGVCIEAKPFQMGVRIEHPQEWLNQLQHGEAAGHKALGAADYKVATRVNKTPVFSFCMCPGGQTIPTVNEEGHLCINGMSLSSRNSKFANSAIVVTLNPETYGGKNLNACLNFVRQVESKCFKAANSSYKAPAQSLMSFIKNQADNKLPETSYPMGLVPSRLDALLPKFVAQPLAEAIPRFEKSLRGYLHPQAIVIAPESRASSPVRIVRNQQDRQSITIKGLYPAGEGAGYAGGIMSSALDGLNAAKLIIEQFAPPSAS